MAIGLTFLLFFSACSQSRQPLAAPTLLPGTDRDMLTPGYWICRHPSPDTLVLSDYQISALNRYIETELKTVQDITQIPVPLSGKDISKAIQKEIDRQRGGTRYFSTGLSVTSDFYDHMVRDKNLSFVGADIFPTYGLVIRFSDQRLLPTARSLYTQPLSTDFDEIQNNALDLGTSVMILHQIQIQGEKWSYVVAPDSSGWVETRNIARCSAEALEEFVHPDRLVVITRPKADVYLNPELTECNAFVQMGVRLPMVQSAEDVFQVLIPASDEQGYLVKRNGYVRKAQAREGYLPYTARNILQQAFEMLNALYGWGGMFGEQDCSRFVQQVFATVGIMLPRNSLDQAAVGKLLAEFAAGTPAEKKAAVLSGQAVGGTALLYLKGHIMLYLGESEYCPYVIHDTWSYRVPDGQQELTYKIGRVSVTSLDLGKGSHNGSLLDRLKSVRVLQ